MKKQSFETRQIHASEDSFYADINISPLLAQYPHITENGRKNLENAPENSMGCTYTPSTMQQMGVKNIVLTDSAWVFEKTAYDKKRPEYYGATLVLIDTVSP